MSTATPAPKPRAYTIDQVAAQLQLPWRQVYDQVRAGRIAGFRIGKHWRIPDHELERLLHSADRAGHGAA